MAIFIVLPVFNVESTIAPFIRDLLGEIPELKIICSEDGSSDATRAVIEKHFSSNHNVVLLNASPRKGYALAVVDGISAIKGQPEDIVIFSDSDAQITAKEIARVYRQFIENQNKTIDIMTGCRINRADGKLRLVMSRMWYGLVKVLWPAINLRDPSSPLVVTSFATAEKISNKWLELGRRKIEGFWWEFQVIASAFNLVVAEYIIAHEPRKDGQSTQVYKVRKLFGILFRNLVDLIRLRSRLL